MLKKVPFIKWNTWEAATASWAMVAICMATLLFFVATSSKGIENILYESLTCDELVYSWRFNLEIVKDIIGQYDNCLNYVDPTLEGHDHGRLGCMFIREHGVFVQGIVNDIASVFDIKCAGK